MKEQYKMNKDDALGKAKGKQKALLQTDRNSISLRCGRGALLHHNAPSQRPRIRHGIGLGLDRALGYHQHAGACAAINRVLRCLWHQYATHCPSLFVVQWAPVRRGPVKGAGGCRGCKRGTRLLDRLRECWSVFRGLFSSSRG